MEGSGIVPIIKYKKDYYFVLFETNIKRRENNIYPIIEESGGNLEKKNLKNSAIRELSEESSMLFNLFNHREKLKTNIKLLTYMDYFIYIGTHDIDKLRESFISNNRNFWKNKFSVYTENKNIIFIPLKNIFGCKINREIQDVYYNMYHLFRRTFAIFQELSKKYTYNEFLQEIRKNKIKLNKKDIHSCDYIYKNKKYTVSSFFAYF